MDSVFFFFLGFFAFNLAALVLAADFFAPPILPISEAVICLLIELVFVVANCSALDAPVPFFSELSSLLGRGER